LDGKLIGRRVNNNTIEIIMTNLSEFTRITKFLKMSKIKHYYRVHRYSDDVVIVTIRVKVKDVMDEAILRSMNIEILDNRELQKIGKHCLIVAEAFKRNRILKAIASYS